MDVTQAELDYIVRKITEGIKKELRATTKKVNELYTFIFRNGFKARVENIETLAKETRDKIDRHIDMREVTCPNADEIAQLKAKMAATEKRHTAEDAVSGQRSEGKPRPQHYRREDDVLRYVTAGAASLGFVLVIIFFGGYLLGWW